MVLAGDKVRASDVPDRVGCTLRRVAVQSIADAVNVSVSWDTEDEDTDGFVAVTSTTVTIPAGLGGVYLISASAVITGYTGTRAYIQIVPTSTVTGTPTEVRTNTDNVEDRLLITWLTKLEAGDSFLVQLFQDDAGGVARNANARLACYRVSL